jgi:hypothetical protein
MGSWFSFLFPRRGDSATAGLEEAKNRAGECPPPDSDPFSDAQFGKNIGCLSTKFAENRESPIRVPQTQSAFHSHAQRNAFIVAVCVNNPQRSPFLNQSLTHRFFEPHLT